MSEIRSSLIFNNYMVNKVDFTNNVDCTNKNLEIDFKINSKVDFADSDKFILKLIVDIFPNAKENNYPFNLKAELMGAFEISGVKEEDKMVYAEKNAVAILFPYVRALVTSYTAISNIDPLILPPINVVNYINNKKEKAQE